MLDSLLLTPCRISSEEDDDDEDDDDDAHFHLNPSIWQHLPESLLQYVLALLPFPSVLRFRSVCKQWKALFASPGFHHVPSHKAYVPPWLFIRGSNGRRRCSNDHHRSVWHSDLHRSVRHTSNDRHMRRYEDRLLNRDDDHGHTHGSSHNHGDQGRVLSSRPSSQGSQGRVLSSQSPSQGSHTSGRCRTHHNSVKEILLIFDCESESWRLPLLFPSGFKRSCNSDSFAVICSFQEQVLIPSISHHIYLYNPAAPSCQELPSFISIQGLPEAVGMCENQNLAPFLHDKAAKNMQVVAAGTSGNGTLVLEVFHSSTGCWHVCGNLPSAIAFSQKRMVHCNGFFYALINGPRTMLSLNRIIVGQNIEWTLHDPPVPPNQDDNRHTGLGQLRLVACGNRVLLIGATLTHPTNRRRQRHGQHTEEQCHILIWQFYPGANSNACWELCADMPRQIFHAFYGEKSLVNIECRAHGDLVFFQDQDSCRILMYDMSQDEWRFSPRCEYNIDALAFVWEPLLN